MAYSFDRKTDNVDIVYAADVNELQSAVEELGDAVDTMSNINSSFMLSAAGIIPATTSGCSDPVQVETTTNKVNFKYVNFDKDSIEIGWWNHPLPSDYGGGTITYKVYWAFVGATAYKVAWDLSAVAIGNNDAYDAAVGTEIQVNDEGSASSKIYTTDESSALTIAGSPAAGDMVFWRLRRVANDGTNDTLDVDARFLYVVITYTRA